MAFPSDLEIEVAFNNDINEADYAQTGWTSILPFVASFEGDLRGREYELDRTEAGTISVTLDNADGRFIPGSVGSPYYPNVKSDRRFRIRGKNMVHPNVARGGSRDHNTTGLVATPQEALTVLAGGTPTFTITTKALDDPHIITATTQDTANGHVASNANDGVYATKWAATATTGTLTYQLPSGTTARSYSIRVADDSTKDPVSWTFDGSNDGTTWSNQDTQTAQVFDERYQTNTYTIPFPFYFRYYRLVITANNGHASVVQLSELIINHNLDDNFLADTDMSHYFQVTLPSGQTPLNVPHRTIGWYGPLEYGTRLTHSGYIWRLSGTEPAGFKIRLEMAYFDATWTEITSSSKPFGETSTVPSDTVPLRYNFSHTPPPSAKYGLVTVTFVFGATTNSTDLVYGVTGIQSELTTNLAPDISGYRDLFNWQIEGTGDSTTTGVGTDPATSYLEVAWDAADTSISTTIPHLIPGESYTATVEAQIVGSQPSVLFTGDEARTGTLISSTSFATYSTTFVAEQSEQELAWVLQGTSTLGVGLRLRKLNVRAGFGPVPLAATAWDSDVTAWTRPKDIFEGWVESWPVRGGSTEMTITVVDRLKRLGEVDLENTLAEAMFQDRPVLMLPLYDSMLDTPGRFSQLGTWADEEGGPTYVDIGNSRGDLGLSSYTTSTDDGPTGEASLKLNPTVLGVSGTGYFVAIPYTQDYVAPNTPVPPPPPAPGPPPAPSTPKPSPKPPPPRKYTYTKTWYANWSRSYDSDNSTRFDDPPTMYQGSYTGSNNQKSLAGFDYNNIKAILNGAEILEAYITVKNEHARWNKGLYVFVGTHNYTSKPGTWNNSTVRERRWKRWVAEGAAVTINIGVSTGNEFKVGTSRGISIGPEPTNDHDNYGIFRGASQSGKPYLTIKYRK